MLNNYSLPSAAVIRSLKASQNLQLASVGLDLSTTDDEDEKTNSDEEDDSSTSSSSSVDESSSKTNNNHSGVKYSPTIPEKEKQIASDTAQKLEKLREMLHRTLPVTRKDSIPYAVPYKKLADRSMHLKGKSLPKEHETQHALARNTQSQTVDWVANAIQQRKKRICLYGCRYDVVHAVAIQAGFELVGENEMWNINWSDAPLPQDKIFQMRRIQDAYSVFWGEKAPPQKTNHFPGMYEICRKDRLGRNLKRFRRLFSLDYDFFPETWDLPTEQADLLHYAKRRKNLTFIIKPDSGCQGKGIFLIKNLKKLLPFSKCVCQVYVPNPFLIDGYKFDQRIYVLVTCVDPLRIYVYDEGIARFATVKYEPPSDENLEVVFMHLTNYSLNKFSESYVREGSGSKRKTSAIYRWMKANGHDVSKLIRAIDEVIVKTLLCVAPTLRHNYKTCFPKRDRGSSCFEILGFDILIDRQLNPVLLEVNHSPSFNLDLPVDGEVKTELLRDMFNMVYLGNEQSAAIPNPEEAHRDTGKLRGNKDDHQQPRRRGKSHIRSSPSPVQTVPVLKPVEFKSPSDILPKFLEQQFKHEIENKGNFRLIYSSDDPGKYTKLVEETYSGFPSSSANNGLLLEQILDHQDGKKGKLNRNIIFESSQVDRQGQNALKMTTQYRQSFMDTRISPSIPTCSSLNAQRGFQIVSPLPRSDLALTKRIGYGNRLRKMQEFLCLQNGTGSGTTPT